MGLRPSVKNEDGTFSKTTAASSKTQRNNESSCRCESSPCSHYSPSSSSSSPSSPQREAWTARGQLLLNFHHAISRAINSPEMARKCNQIAEDMSRAEEDEGKGSASIRDLGNNIEHNNASNKTRDTSRSIAEEYSAEAALIVENKSRRDAVVRNKSLALGFFTFVALRGGRGLGSWARKTIADRAAGGAGGSTYRFDKVSSSSTKSMESASVAAAESLKRHQQPPVSKLRKFLLVALDVTISASMTLLSGTFLFMPRPSAYIEDMSKLPLVEGKSVYAEMVCPALLKEYRRAIEQYGGRWPVRKSGIASGSKIDDPGPTQEDVSLNVIRTFVENCSKRSKYERALLEERNALSSLDDESASSTAVSRLMKRITRRKSVDKSHSIDDSMSEKETGNNKLGTVSIPSPGVPENIAVDIDFDVFSLVGGDDEEVKKENSVPK